MRDPSNSRQICMVKLQHAARLVRIVAQLQYRTQRLRVEAEHLARLLQQLSVLACGVSSPSAISACRNSVVTLLIDFASTARSSSVLSGASSRCCRSRNKVVRSSCSTSTRCRFIGTSIDMTTSSPASVRCTILMSSNSIANTSADSCNSCRVMIIGGCSFSSCVHQVMTGVMACSALGPKSFRTSSRFTSEYCSWKSSRAAEP